MRAGLVFLIIVVSGGCSSLLKSRYAMDDPVYAAKYAKGADRLDLVGKAKQALDARHTGDLKGVYLSGGMQYQAEADQLFLGAELGCERYATSWLSGRAAIAATLGNNEGYLGFDTGLRLQTPTRIAPFVGMGMFLGASRRIELADSDGLNNDDDFFTDEPGEEAEVDDWLGAVYPEVGVHFWLNGRWRLTAYGRYFVTTAGRAHDDWLVGGQLTVFQR